MRKGVVIVMLLLMLGVVLGPAKAAFADACYGWAGGGFGVGLICFGFDAPQPGNFGFGPTLFSLGMRGVHTGGGNCSQNVGPNHTLEMTLIANVNAGGGATGNFNIGWVDNAHGTGCSASMTQCRMLSNFGSATCGSFNFSTGAPAPATTLAFVGIFASLEEALAHIPPDDGSGGPKP